MFGANAHMALTLSANTTARGAHMVVATHRACNIGLVRKRHAIVSGCDEEETKQHLNSPNSGLDGNHSSCRLLSLGLKTTDVG